MVVIFEKTKKTKTEILHNTHWNKGENGKKDTGSVL